MSFNKKKALIDNIEAIKIAFHVHKENRKATISEIQALKKFSGFGGLKCVLYDAFNERDLQRMPDSEKDMFDLVKQLNTVISENADTAIQYKEYMDSIRSSVQTAFYTPAFVPNAIGSLLKGQGILIKTVLDPSAGVGIFGQMIQKCWDDANVDCFEKDLLTAKILSAINPSFKVKASGFETIPPTKAGKYDLVTSNIPFGNFKVFDPSYRKSGNRAKAHSLQYIHEYFFLKGIDALRPGGILAYITSKGMMDSSNNYIVRQAIIEQCKLLSAVRFPDNLFVESSGINVPSDLVLLQKRIPGSETDLTKKEEQFILSSPMQEGINVNEYFQFNPEHFLTETIEIGTNQFGKPDFIYRSGESMDILEQRLIKTLSEDITENLSIRDYQEYQKEANKKPIPVQKVIPNNSILTLFDVWDAQDLEEQARKTGNEPYTLAIPSLSWHENGMLAIDENKIGIITNVGETPTFSPIEITDKQKNILIDYLAVRDSYAALYYTEKDTGIEQPGLRKDFNLAYDNFRQLHGPLNEKKNQKVLMKDTFQMAVQSVELYINEEYIKGDLFFGPLKKNAPEQLSCDLTPIEALMDSYNRFGIVDLNHICMASNSSEGTVLESLKGRICYAPDKMEWQPYEMFISCDVYEKYDLCNEYLVTSTDPQEKQWIEDSLNMLKEARPSLMNFSDIDLNMGERWIPLSYYEKFSKQLLHTDILINYFSSIDRFVVTLKGSTNMQINDQWAIYGENKTYNGLDLLRYALEDRYPDVTKTVFDKKEQKNKQIADPELTQLMAGKVADIREQFIEFMQKIPLEEKQVLMDQYNRKFNCFARPKFDGSHQTFPGLHLENFGDVTELYSSQKDAVWMGIMNQGGNVDHSVGNGKTLTMCILSHELVRLGIVVKPIITGLRGNINAIAETYAKAYPQDKMLFIRSEEMSVKRRIEMFHQIKNNNWDVIILSHENFGKIKQSSKVEAEMIKVEIDKLIATYELGKEVFSKRDRKNLEKAIENKKVQLKNILDDIKLHKTQGTAIPDFEEMGIGHVLVDESHNYKNLGYGATKHNRVSGLGDAKGSLKAQNLLLSIRTIQHRISQDQGATFFSGTTISNSLIELYSNFVYLRPNALAKQGITCIDAWLANYAQKTSEFEISITNEIINKERFRFFIKVSALSMFYSQITDFRTADDIGKKRPKLVEELRICKRSPEQDMFAEILKNFALTGNYEKIKPYVKSTNDKAKMLIATDLERKMALDMRILDPANFSDHPNNKISTCAADVAADYYKYNEQKGTQFIFTDLGAYKGNGSFTPVEALKEKLVYEYGIPTHEIRFIQEFDTDKKKAQFTKLMNVGEIRIAIGGTSNMGTGINAQERCVAINHIDIPWRPSDLEQRNGRGCRPGNLIALNYCDNIIKARYYCTEKSLDAYKFNLLKFKQGFIFQLKSCSLNIQKLDEGSLDEKTGMNHSEYCALISGNTDLLEKIKLDKTIAHLESSRKVFYNDLDYSKYNYQSAEKALASDNRTLERIKLDEQSLTPEIKKRLSILQNYDTVTANFRATSLVRFEGHMGISSSEKIGELIQMKAAALIRQGPNKHQQICTLGEFKVCIDSESNFSTGQVICSLSVHGPGNISYKHHYGSIPMDKELTALSPERALLKIPILKEEYLKKIKKGENLLNELSITIQRTWGKEDKLAELKAQRIELEKKISRSINENSVKPTEGVGEVEEINDEEFSLYQQKMEAKADLEYMGLADNDINNILEGKEIMLHDCTLTSPYKDNEQISCSSAHFTFNDNKVHINGIPIKDYFQKCMEQTHETVAWHRR